VNESVREFLHILFKRKRFVVIAFLAIATPIIVLSLLRPPSYRAAAKLLVVGSRSYLQLSPQEVKKAAPMPEAQVIFAEIENLKNRSFLLDAAKHLEVDIVDPVPDDPEERARATAAQIRNSLEITAFPKSPMIEVAYRDQDAHKAAAVVNTLVDTYLEYHPSLYESPDVANFFDQRMVRIQDELRKSEDKLDSYQRKTGIVDLEQQQDETVRQMMSRELAMRETGNQIAQAAKLVSELEDALAKAPERVSGDVNMINNPVARALDERIGLLTVELSELRQKYTDADRRVRDKNQQIVELKARVAEQPERIIGSERFEISQIRQNLQEELLRARANHEALIAKQATLQQDVADYNKEIVTIDEAGSNLRELEDEVEQHRVALQNAMKQRDEAELSLEMSADKLDTIRIVDRAAPPSKPYDTNAALTILVALIAGLGLGVAGAFGLEFLYQSYHFGSDIERELELPVLGIISDIRAG
jgi:uncharacterized protein involved in exopolysaccharide biosynthesis